MVGAVAFATALAVAAPAGAAPAGDQGAGSENPCALPDALLAAGEAKAATAEYVKLLGADPALPCAQDGLAGINEKSRPSEILDDADDVAKDVAKAIGLTVAFVLLLLLAATLLAAVVRRPRWLLERLPAIGRVMRPQLRIAAFDDGAAGDAGKGAGAALAARVTERLHRYREHASGESSSEVGLDMGALGNRFADLAADNDSLNDALDAASGVDDRAKVVAAAVKLLHAILPSRRFTVSGVVDPPAGGYVSATVRIEQGSRVAEVVQARGPRPAEVSGSDFLTLAEPIATWVQYEVARALTPGRRKLPIDAPESFALAREAVEQQLAGDYDQALGLYERAVAMYGSNWAARVGQAAVEARMGRFERSIATLGLAVAARKRAPSDGDRRAERDGNYFRLLYQRSAQRLNLTVDEVRRGAATATEDRLTLWRDEAVELGVAIDRVIHEVGQELSDPMHGGLRLPSPGEARRRRASVQLESLRSFLADTVRPCAAVVAGGFELHAGVGDTVADRIREGRSRVDAVWGADPQSRGFSYNAWFDRACFEATVAAMDSRPKRRERALDAAYGSLRTAFTLAIGRRRGELVEWSRHDPTLAELRSARRRDFIALAREFGPGSKA